ncbi:MAG: hypothetical protein IJ144_02395 [Prevotella sp.]|nr:hypothetical protein [Prevotella sp.]
MTGKRIAWWLPLVALFIGCGGGPTAQELVEIDSLLTWAGIALGSLLFVVVLLIVYIRYRRAKERLVKRRLQMLHRLLQGHRLCRL